LLLYCVALFIVRPATACSLFTVLRASHSNARFGQAQLAHLSSSGSCRVPPRQAALRASLKHSAPYASRVRIASARVPGHKVAPPRRHRSCRADAPDRSCRAAAPSSLRRAPAQTRRANQGAGARGQVRLRQRLLLECSEPGVRLAGRPRYRATQQRAPLTRAADDKRLLLPVIWLVAKRNQARTSNSEREWHTQQVSAFRRGRVGACAPDAHEKGRARRSTTRCHSASCRTLDSSHTGTLQLHALLHLHVPCRSLFLLLNERRCLTLHSVITLPMVDWRMCSACSNPASCVATEI